MENDLHIQELKLEDDKNFSSFLFTRATWPTHFTLEETKMSPYPTSKPNVMETTNLACGVVYT